MATLTGNTIKDTYKSLLKVNDNGELAATLQELTDGLGNGSGISINTSGDLKAAGILEFGSLKDTGENITISKFVDAADGIATNDNDTTIPTTAAIIDYVAAQITLEDLDFSGDTGTGSVDLDSQVFSIRGTANEIETLGSGQTLTIGLVDSPTVSGTITAGTITDGTAILTSGTLTGNLTGTVTGTSVLADGVTATTQITTDNSTKVATTAFVKSVLTLEDLDFQGDTGTGSVDLDSQSLDIAGGTGINTAASGQTLTVNIDSTVATLTGTQTLTNKTIDADNNTVSNLEVDNLKAGVLDTDLTTVSATDDTLASAKAIKTYVDANITAQDLDITDGTVTSAVDLDSQTMTIQGTANEVEVGLVDQTFTIGLPDDVTIAGDLTVNTNTLYVDAANNRVGIGTTSPNSVLHIANTTPEIYLEDTNLSSGDAKFLANNGNLGLFSDVNNEYASSIMYFNVDGSEHMRIDSSGNVGIGTASVNSKVQIEQAQQISGAFSNPFIKLSNSAQTNNTGTTAIALATSTADNYGYAISAKRGTTGADSDFIITHHDNSLTGTPRFVIDGNGDISFRDTSANEAFYWDASTARLGIGTTSPSDNLHISGTTASIRLQDSDGTDTFGRLRYTGSSVYFMSRNNTSDGNFIFIGNNGTSDTEYMRIHSGGDISFRDTSNNQAFYWDASATRLGIGTTSPSAKLDIEGTDAKIEINNTTTTTTDLVLLDLTGTVQGSGVGNERAILLGKSGNSARQAKIAYSQNNSNGQLPALSFFTGDNVDSLDERLRILSSGGITFNGDTATANALDDYEEGTFTPELADAASGGNTASPSDANGSYVKVGSMVTISLQLQNTDLTGMTGTNNAYIRGLPFSAKNLTGAIKFNATPRINLFSANANNMQTTVELGDNTNYMYFEESLTNSGNAVIATVNQFSNGTDIFLTMTYFAD